jgi:hypothetical protein
MGNKVTIGILIVITLILSGAGFTWFKNNSQTSSSPLPSPLLQSSVSPSASAESDTRVTLKDLFASSKNQKCTFSDSSSGSSGTVYITGNKMRGDFSSTVHGQTVISHMIVDNQISYVWSDASTQGVKLSYEKIEQLTTATASAQSSGSKMPISLDQKVSYQCEAWISDPAVLSLPSTVKFIDFSSLIPQIKASGSASGAATIDSKSAACQACDQLTGATRDQCRKALSCTP